MSELTAEVAALYIYNVFMKGVSWRGGMTVPGVGVGGVTFECDPLQRQQ